MNLLRLTAWPALGCFLLLTLPGLELWGYDLFSWVEWILGGLFGLLTVVKALINT